MFTHLNKHKILDLNAVARYTVHFITVIFSSALSISYIFRCESESANLAARFVPLLLDDFVSCCCRSPATGRCPFCDSTLLIVDTICYTAAPPPQPSSSPSLIEGLSSSSRRTLSTIQALCSTDSRRPVVLVVPCPSTPSTRSGRGTCSR